MAWRSLSQHAFQQQVFCLLRRSYLAFIIGAINLHQLISSFFLELILPVFYVLNDLYFLLRNTLIFMHLHSGSKCLPKVACLWSKMFQRVGMKEGGLPPPPAFPYLIPMVWRACDLNLVMITSLASKCQDFKLRGHSTTTWTEFCHFLTPPPCVDSFYTLSVDKNRYCLTPSPLISST